MKPILQFNKTILLFIFLSFVANATNNADGKYTKKKTINKTYAVSPTANLNVDNSYGNVDVITWSENRIVFEITITTTGDDEEKVQERLDAINIEFEGASHNVSAKTKFGKSKSKSWWSWNSKGKVHMKVDYLIKMPVTNNLGLSNDYGTINLDKLEGRANISCDYGKIITKELLSNNNTLSFDYTKNCYFEYINKAEINADYSDFTVSKTNNLDINADYTNINIEIAENINYNCDYGNVKIDNVNNVVGNGDYLTTSIGNVYKNLTLNADYGNIKIKNITQNAGNVTIKSDYVGIKIGYESSYNFNFNIKLDYGSLKNNGALEFTEKKDSSTSKYYSGFHGSNNSSNNITIDSNYGSVTVIEN
ncbi:DUF4097 family beta strand repeat-containing protein [Snuella sedimenti]|uniref:DUF4097 domain-containing protein n=1 Tax=Snuella sedimenti TaxID=2798802 RepID=A0A8J7J126_9FLAO|nr:hypothetical protein [Snuella sedimenti]MBJ6367657.1 hypothetical protein [Snuella sedimenti]